MIRNRLCLPAWDEDEEFFEEFNPLVSNVTVVRIAGSLIRESELYVHFSDRTLVKVNVQQDEESMILARMRMVMARSAYLAMRRRRMVWDALSMGLHDRLGAGSLVRLLDDELIVILIETSV
jgi:hypothetical protein